MKKITYFALGILIFSAHYTQAQVQLDAVNVGNKANTTSYIDVRYYYFPNLQAYFDTKKGLYIYRENKNWITSENIDMNSRGYSLNNGAYEMIKDYLGDNPISQFEAHKQKYPANYSSKRRPPVKTAIASISKIAKTPESKVIIASIE